MLRLGLAGGLMIVLIGLGGLAYQTTATSTAQAPVPGNPAQTDRTAATVAASATATVAATTATTATPIVSPVRLTAPPTVNPLRPTPPAATPSPQPSPTPTATPVRDTPPTPAPAYTPTSVPSPVPTLTPAPRPVPDVLAPRRVLTVPILMYHYISVPPPDADKYRRDLSATPEQFEAHLRYLNENGFTSVSLYDLYRHLNTGVALPPKPVVLTFDDGYRDAYTNAFPLLVKYGFTGTFFIISDLVHANHPAYLTWDMVKEMASAGMSIESHSRTHPDMRGRSYEFLVWQILGPIESIQHFTGARPRFFCYPSGKYDADVIAVLKSAEVWAAVTTEYGRRQTLAHALTWPRVRIHGTTTLTQFAKLVE